ncbi:MAG: hypothetical protein P1P89_11485 [Desulfobacterales bacterium]|nr:hypothetical protein [Desulfobacterales bacterium]
MKNNFSSNREFPPCGYGQSGLCCSACLEGPCRISPFDRTIEKGKCGASADRLVAANLLRIIAAETAARLADLAQIVHQGGASSIGQPVVGMENPGVTKYISGKYGLNPDAIRKTGCADLLKHEVKALLSLDLSAGHLTPFWSRLYPAQMFPRFYTGEILPRTSLTLTALSAFQPVQKEDAAMEDMLRTCLKVSLVFLICEELILDLEILREKGSSRGAGKSDPEVAETLDATQPSPVVILLKTPGQGGDDHLEQEIRTFRKQWQGALVEMSRPPGFFDISRQFYRRYSRPLTHTAPLVFALTPSSALVVGILACGCSVFSRPGLPLYGSEPVSRFFSREPEGDRSAVYLAPEAGDLISVAHNYFRKMP